MANLRKVLDHLKAFNHGGFIVSQGGNVDTVAVIIEQPADISEVEPLGLLQPLLPSHLDLLNDRRPYRLNPCPKLVLSHQATGQLVYLFRLCARGFKRQAVGVRLRLALTINWQNRSCFAVSFGGGVGGAGVIAI